MKAWKISATCILLTFLCLFSSVGYAAVSGTVRVSGSVKNDIPYGLFITDVVVQGQTRVEKHEYSYLPYSTSIDSLINKSSNNSSTTVTYRVTVLNNTELTYSYRGIYYQTNLDGYNGNNYVSATNSNSKIGVVCSLASASAESKKVEPGKSLTFTVTYTVGSSRRESVDWKTLVNFQFGIHVNGEREAINIVEGKFLNILNTQSTYEQLIDALDNKFDGYQEWTSNYIGNVTGSSSDDSMAVNTLFAGQLQITVGNEQLDATVLIKHENLDWNNYTGDDYVAVHPNGGEFRGYGCEMTLYLTVDPLDRAGAYVPVYAIVYTCDRDVNGNKISDWYRIGATYAGTANVVTYDGGNGTGSFVTDNWISNAADYKLIDGYSFNINGESYVLDSYSHSVANGTSIKNIVVETDVDAQNTLQSLLNDANRLINNNDYAGLGIELIEETYGKYSHLYTVDESGNHTVNSDATIAELSPALSDLFNVVNQALIEIDSLVNP